MYIKTHNKFSRKVSNIEMNVEGRKWLIAGRKTNNHRVNKSQQGARQSLNQERPTRVDSWEKHHFLIIHAQKSRALGCIGLLTPM
jgi:hypothetical protein